MEEAQGRMRRLWHTNSSTPHAGTRAWRRRWQTSSPCLASLTCLSPASLVTCLSPASLATSPKLPSKLPSLPSLSCPPTRPQPRAQGARAAGAAGQERQELEELLVQVWCRVALPSVSGGGACLCLCLTVCLCVSMSVGSSGVKDDA